MKRTLGNMLEPVKDLNVAFVEKVIAHLNSMFGMMVIPMKHGDSENVM